MTGRLLLLPRVEVGPRGWDDAVAVSNDAWLWHLSDLIDATSAWPGTRDISFAVAADDGSPLAIMPLQVIGAGRGLSGRRLFSLGGCAFHPRLEDDQRRLILDRVVEELDRLLQAEQAGEVEVRVSPLTPRLGDLSPGAIPPGLIGFESRDGKSWVVDLALPLDTIRSSYSTLTRRELRKAEGAGVSVREATGSADLDRYYELHLQTYDRTGVKPHPHLYFQKIFENFVPRGRARVLFAEHKGRVVAAQNTGIFKDGAWYWTGASVAEKSDGDNRLLFHRQIAAAQASGALCYDVGEAFPGTADPKEAGLSRFKGSFGGVLAAYPTGTRRNPALRFRFLRTLRACARPARRFFHESK